MAPINSPAWKLFSYENMRGKRVGLWRVITHIRNGHWKAYQIVNGKAVYKTIRLDWFGKRLR